MSSPAPVPKEIISRAPNWRHRHVWQNFNFWLVVFTAVYSLISLAALYIAIESAHLARRSADANVATVRPWLDTSSFKFLYSPPGARKQIAPEFSFTMENLGKTPARALTVTLEFAFDDQSTDKQFTGCPDSNLNRVHFMIAGQPGETVTIPVETIGAEQFAKLKPGPGNHASVYAHGCVRYRDVLTDQVRLTEFCVRYYGGDDYVTCDNSNLMD